MNDAETREIITQSGYVAYGWRAGRDYVVGAEPMLGNRHRFEVKIALPVNDIDAAVGEALAVVLEQIRRHEGRRLL